MPDHAANPHALLLGKRQEVLRQAARFTDVSRDPTVRPAGVQGGKDAGVILQIAAELESALACFGHFRSCVSPRRDRRADPCNLDAQLKIVSFRSGRELVDLLQRATQLRNRFKICRSLRRAACGFEPHLHGTGNDARLGQMLRKIVGLRARKL
jgi:hypothetical protein